MYLGGNGGFMEYNFLQGAGGATTGSNPYPGLSTNQAWVNNFQDPFNKNVLTPAAAQGVNDPAGAYAVLAPAYAQIRNQAVAFVASYPASMQPAAQTTINGWSKDWPLIEGFLARWQGAAPSAVVAAPAAGAQPTTIFQDQAPAIYGPVNPSVFAASSPGSPAPYLPAAPANVNVTTPAATDWSATLTEYLPWIAGAAAVGLVFFSGGRRRH
jgi:hypothetical protein